MTKEVTGRVNIILYLCVCNITFKEIILYCMYTLINYYV